MNSQDPLYFGGVGVGQAVDQVLQHLAQGVGGEVGKPAHARLERSRAQLPQHLGGEGIDSQTSGFIQRLQELADNRRLAELGTEGVESLRLLRLQVGNPLLEELALPQDRRGAPKVAGVEQIGEQTLEDPENFLADLRFRLQLEEVKQHVERAAPNVSLVLLVHLFG